MSQVMSSQLLVLFLCTLSLSIPKETSWKDCSARKQMTRRFAKQQRQQIAKLLDTDRNLDTT